MGQIACKVEQLFCILTQSQLRLQQLIEEAHLRQLHHGAPLLAFQGTCQFMASEPSAVGKQCTYAFVSMSDCLEVEGVAFLPTSTLQWVQGKSLLFHLSLCSYYKKGTEQYQ